MATSYGTELVDESWLIYRIADGEMECVASTESERHAWEIVNGLNSNLTRTAVPDGPDIRLTGLQEHLVRLVDLCATVGQKWSANWQ